MCNELGLMKGTPMTEPTRATPTTPTQSATGADDEQLGTPTLDRSLSFCRGLNELLERRRDLSGVVPMADLIHESASWAA